MKRKKLPVLAMFLFVLVSVYFICYKVVRLQAENDVSKEDELFQVLTTQQDDFQGALVVDMPQDCGQLQSEVTQEVAAQLSHFLSEGQVVEPIVIASSEHLFDSLPKKVFITEQERQLFFAAQGRQYLNKTEVAYKPMLDMDVYASEKFLADQTGNKQLTHLYADDIGQETLAPMSIRWISPEVGHGIFAEADLVEGDFVGIYGGVVQDRDFVSNKDYAWAYPMQTLQGGKTILDANYKGNELCLINDSRNPNCVVKYIIGKDGLWHVCYIAAKPIKKGEQFFVSYGSAYWDSRKYKYQELSDVDPLAS